MRYVLAGRDSSWPPIDACYPLISPLSETQTDAPDPSVAASNKPEKRVSSLRFSSKADGDPNGPNKGKRKAPLGASYEGDDDGADAEQEDGGDGFSDLVKRAKTDPSAATRADIANRKGSTPVTHKQEATDNKKQAPLTKEEKSAMKAKRKAAKKMLSFED